MYVSISPALCPGARSLALLADARRRARFCLLLPFCCRALQGRGDARRRRARRIPPRLVGGRAPGPARGADVGAVLEQQLYERRVAFSRGKMDATAKELVDEAAMAQSLLS